MANTTDLSIVTFGDCEAITKLNEFTGCDIKNGFKPFFNIQQYVNYGLVEWTKTYRTNNAGNKVVDGASYKLTEKANDFLNVAV